MYASWARASRPAALCASQARLATRSDRCFHVSAPARAAADATDPNNESQDGADKPADSESSGTGPENAKDDELFGEKGLNNNGDARGRQRRPNGTARSRALKRKTPEELPPIHLPANFYEDHVFRNDDVRDDLTGLRLKAPDASGSREAIFLLALEELKQQNPDQFNIIDRVWNSVFEAAAWNDDDIRQFQDNPRLEDIEMATLRGATMLIAGWNAVMTAAPTMLADSPEPLEEYTKTLQNVRDYRRTELRADQMKAYEMAVYYVERMLPYDLAPEDTSSMLRNILRSKLRYQGRLGLVHHDALIEATSSIRADFAISPPKNIKVTELKRPVTVLHFPYYSGFEWPKHVMRDVAAELGADMVQLTAQDIARIAGSYLGQDISRAPGPLSLLGYKTAENAGRIKRRAPEQSDEELRNDMAFSIVMHGEKPKKEGKKKLSVMDYVLGEPSRGKSDEMWVDLKINAVLEELVHATSSVSSGQRPLIVHIHDINALNMDDECGAIILGKLRKIIDDLWVEGKKVVLVGTCSSLGAPTTYHRALKDLKEAERFITLHTKPYKPVGSPSNDASTLIVGHTGSKPFIKRLEETARNEYLDENARNIAAMLGTLVGASHDSGAPQINFSLTAMEPRHRPDILSQKLLPVSEVYRVVKTMIGLRKQHPEVFDQAVLEEALRLIKHVDETNDRMNNILDKVESEIKRNLMTDTTGRTTDYEKRFLSALVNPKDLKTTFNDIHAPRETIESIKMLTQLSLLRPEAFAYGVLATDRIPGCLLYGPPGTGKTLLAKAVAKESGANMIEVSGASINQMYVGESEKNIKALFTLAKKKEPLVIFIDEADALLGARGGRNDAAGRRDVINQFLREWDGMETSKAFIMVATNRPFDLDEAVLRRLPRKLLIDLPLEADRAAIFRIHLNNEALDDTVSIEQMAKQTTLYSGSDLKNVCVAAAMAAVKEELEASEKHTGPEPYVWPAKRILNRRHFDKALSEIPASVSEDMATLNAIKKFDERYGEKKARRKRRGMGFEVIPEATDSHEARVRSDDR
ncbi:Mus7/MMS22 family protein (ATPase) [Seiridium cupressi]